MHLRLFALLLSFGISTFAQKKTYSIVQYGALADGKTNNITAIQKAIDEAEKDGGGTVLVPAGDFVTGVLHLKSNVELNLALNARLMATTKRSE